MNARTVIEDYFAALSENRYPDAVALLAPNVRRWVSGEGSWPFGGWHDDASMGRILAVVGARFPDGVRLRISSIVVEGDRGAVEAEGEMRRSDGRIYANRYHYALTVADGKIIEIREYLDTILAAELLCGPLAS